MQQAPCTVRGPPSSSFLRQQRFRDLLRSPTLTHSWPVIDLQNMERPCKFWQNSPKRWTVGLGKLTAKCGSLSAQLAKPLLSHGLPRAFLWYFLNPDGNSPNKSELSKLQNSSWCAGWDYTSCRNCSDGWTVTPFAATAQFLDRQRVAAVDKEVGGRFSSS